jgi:hypothetical protein
MGAGVAPDPTGTAVGGTYDGAVVGAQTWVQAYVGRVTFRKAIPARMTKANPATAQVMRERWRSMNDPRWAAGLRERRGARAAELGRRGGVVKEAASSCMDGNGPPGGSAAILPDRPLERGREGQG